MLKSPARIISEFLFLIFLIVGFFGLVDRLIITNSPESYPSFLLTPLDGKKAGLTATRELCGEPLEIVVRRSDFLIRCGFAFPRHTWIVNKQYLDSFTGMEHSLN